MDRITLERQSYVTLYLLILCRNVMLQNIECINVENDMTNQIY